MKYIYRFIVHIILYATAFWAIGEYIFPDQFQILPDKQSSYLFVGFIFSLVNGILKPVLKLVTLPFQLLTFGLFSIVINAGLVWIIDKSLDILSVGITMEVSVWWVYVLVGAMMGVVATIIP